MPRAQKTMKDKTASKAKPKSYTKGKPAGENWREIKPKNKKK